MNQTPALPTRRVAVRWPFRILAALICAAGVVVIGGTAIALWHDSPALATNRLLVILPGTLWLLRVAAHAALHGTSVPNDSSWPFASQGVLFAYLILMWFVLRT